MSTDNKIFAFIAAVIGAVIGYFGALPEVIQVLLLLMVLDVALGFLIAMVSKKVAATPAWQGISKKAASLLIVTMAYILTRLAAFDLPLVEAIAAFYIYTEAISILENAAILGVPIPQFLRDALAKLAPKEKAKTIHETQPKIKAVRE